MPCLTAEGRCTATATWATPDHHFDIWRPVCDEHRHPGATVSLDLRYLPSDLSYILTQTVYRGYLRMSTHLLRT